jgi:hypothetical protein
VRLDLATVATKEFVPDEFGYGSEVMAIDSPPEARAHVGAAGRRVLLEAVLHEVANERRFGSCHSVQIVEVRFPVGLPLVALPLDVIEQPRPEPGWHPFFDLHRVDDGETQTRRPPCESRTSTSLTEWYCTAQVGGRPGRERNILARHPIARHSSLATIATYVSHIAPAKAVAEANRRTAHLALQP